MEDSIASVALISSKSELSEALLKNLTDSGFSVNFISQEVNYENILLKNDFFDYIVYLDYATKSTERSNGLFKLALSLSEKNLSKSTFIFNLCQENIETVLTRQKIYEIKKNYPSASIIFLPPIIIELEELSQEILFKLGDSIYPYIFIKNTLEIIKKALISLKYYSNSTLFITRKLHSSELRNLGMIDTSKVTKVNTFPTSEINNKENIAINLIDYKKYIGRKARMKDENNSRGNIFTRRLHPAQNLKSKIFSKPAINRSEEKSNNFKLSTKDRKLSLQKLMISLLLSLIAIALIPMLFILAGSAAFIFGNNTLLNGNVYFSKRLFSAAEKNFYLSKSVSNFIFNSSKLNFPFKSIYSISGVLEEAANVGQLNNDVLINILNLVKQNIYLETFESNLKVDLGEIETNINFIQAGVDNLSGSQQLYFKKVVAIEDISNIKKDLSYISLLANEVGNLLGKEKTANYLILIQDESELRPSGGKIKEAAILSLFKGKVVNYNKLDLKVLEENFKGFIQSPESYKKNLGSEKWKISEGNWNVDFTISANNIAKFISTTEKINLNGVIALNVGQLANLTKNTPAPNANLFEYVANILAINNDQEIIRNIFILFNMLEEKNIIVYSTNPNALDALNKLKWSGSIYDDECADCYKDFFYQVIANLGSYDMRQIRIENDLEILLQEDIIKRKLTTFISNEGSKAYKAYVRIIVPAEVGLGLGKVKNRTGETNFIPETYPILGKKEAGFLVEVVPWETKAFILDWESGSDIVLSKSNAYSLYVQKQPGLKSLPFNLKIKTGQIGENVQTMNLSLTQEGYYVYNTTLSRDFISRIFWQTWQN